MLATVETILARCDSSKTNISPTILFNEGWMIRLLIELSVQEKLTFSDIDFSDINNWYSEGLLSSPFLAKFRQDKLAEGFTHADMAIGDFKVDSSSRGDISINGVDGIFGVFEAKMGSKLSQGTKNAPNYDQASRNLACIAFNTLTSKHKIFFSLVAPQTKINEYKFKDEINLSRMIDKISQRFDMYERDSDVYALKEKVLERANTCSCFVVSYESWIAELSNNYSFSELQEFKEQCYKFNKIT